MELEDVLRDAMIGEPFLHNGFWCVKKDDALAGMTAVRWKTLEEAAKMADTFRGATHPDTAKSIAAILRDNILAK